MIRTKGFNVSENVSTKANFPLMNTQIGLKPKQCRQIMIECKPKNNTIRRNRNIHVNKNPPRVSVYKKES